MNAIEETSFNLVGIRTEVSHESYEKRSFKREVESLLDHVTDVDLDRINELRASIERSSKRVNEVCEKIQALSWHLTDPSQSELEIINDIIVLGKSVSKSSYEMLESLQTLLKRGVLKIETDNFREVISHWEEVLEDTEAVFFTLPADKTFIEASRELETL